MLPIYLHDLTFPALTDLLASWDYGGYHAGRLWNYLYRRLAVSWDEMTDLRPELLARLRERTTLDQPAPRMSIDSQDGLTRKMLLALNDGQTIETVLMRHRGRGAEDSLRPGRSRATACISTQAGCAMGCIFCATGQMGFVRHLRPGEIVGQVLYADRLLAQQDERLRNIVLMGMGEPLHNYDATMTALEILTDDRGLAIAPRYITLSTVGLPPAIRRLADEDRPINLAVSLHAATDEDRRALIPAARRWSLADVIEACHYYVERRGRRIFFEWALIAGQNDTADHAHAVGRLLSGLQGHVNLIPLNPTAGYQGQPTDQVTARRFQKILAGYGLPSTIRQRRGIDIDAGCGQLRARTTSQMLA
jgi:23S rRNA (adenine2503-C2)-methyltransferase